MTADAVVALLERDTQVLNALRRAVADLHRYRQEAGDAAHVGPLAVEARLARTLREVTS